ncbi:MAG: trypsin-like peptidase domain-containing protein, partial [Blastocatellia bacterium]|nr:trypsin-like peptidase domain-containing protein [Blastocatellia bacterium]
MREMILFSSQRIFFGLFLGLACAWFSPSLAQISISGWTKPAAPKAEATPSLTKLAERKEAPQIHRSTNLKIESFKKYSLPAPTAQEMEQREKSRKLKIGVTRSLPQVLNVVAQSSTVAMTEGEVKSLRVASEGAVQIRLHLNRLEIPSDASVFVYAASNPKEFYGPYRNGSSPLWTPPISGGEAVIELFIRTGKDAAKAVSVRLEIDQISHIFRHPKSANTATQQAQVEDAESCNEDVTAEWSETAKSVAMVQFHQPDGEYVCSGVLLNDTKNSGTPYFLTANHCIDNGVTANSTRFHWFFDTASSNPDSNVTYSAEVLQTSDVSDFTLLRIKNPVPAGVRFSGWTTAVPTANTNVTSIHHPAADYKRISFGRIVTNTCPSYLPPEFCDNFHAVRWNIGITEPGSSGGGLWMGSASDPKLIGQLLGGESACQTPNGLDSYGRFDITMEAVARHLTGQGCQYSLSHKKQIVESAGGAAKVQIFVNDISDCSWTARSNVNWITLQNVQGQGDATVNFTVAPNTSGAKRSGLIFVAGHNLRIIQRGAAEICAETPKLALGATISGTLSASNCLSVTGYGAAAVRYTFDTQPGQFFSIAVQATEFDPYVTLIGPDGRVIRENDDIGYNNTNAR